MKSALRPVLAIVAGAALGTAGAIVLYRVFPGPAAIAAPPPAEPAGVDGGPDASGAPDVADASDASDAAADEPEPRTLQEQREALYARLLRDGGLTAEQVGAVRAIFEASPYLGQGNPEVSVHPMTRAECRKLREGAAIIPGEEALCGKRDMVPLYDPTAGESKEGAKACIDQYEFPNLPCEYPVVNVRASEAEAICRAVGERLCDAHEWEGACAGAVRPADKEYQWNDERRHASGMHNLQREIVWAYGKTKDHSLCATNSVKTKDCPGGGWKQCGSNTYPAGAFPACKSSLGVYDQHGNAAEHMNLPTRPEELMSRGTLGGWTEMKGSWFIFSKTEAHLDDCRWREPSWHESRVSSENSHRNYHLGFRCCKDR